MDRRELLAGWMAGAAGHFAGHPLDTIKVRMQADAGGIRDVGAWRCALRTLTEGGWQGFFRGMSVPLLSKSVEQCIAFGVRGAAERALGAIGLGPSGARAGLAGAAAGASTAVLMTPVYLVKVQLQVTPRDRIRGPLAAALATVRSRGMFGLYAGATPILLGTTVAYACRFVSYQHAVTLVEGWGCSQTLSTVIGGGAAGMATWASHYPLDLLSARMQARATETSGKSTGTMFQHLHEVLQEHGPRGLFRGLGPCLLRAFPVNAIIFLAYEQASKLAETVF